MPGRGKGRRGGRGGSSSRGKARSNYGRPNPQKKKRPGAPVRHAMPEFDDLSEPKPNTFAYYGRRPGRMAQEAEYTASHTEQTMRKSLRSRPVEFVKAKHVYDPSAELYKQVEASRLRREPSGSPDIESLSLEPAAPEETETIEGEDEVMDSESQKEVSESKDEDDEADEEMAEETSQIPVETTEIDLDDVLIMDDQPDPSLVRECREVSYERPNKSKAIRFNTLEHDPYFAVGKTLLRTTMTDDGPVVDFGQLERASRVRASKLPELVIEDQVDSDEEVGYRDYIQNIMGGVASDDDDVYDSETNFDEMAESENEDEGDDEEDENNEDDEANDEAEDPTPEYGFHPDDFAFDVSSISITNVRFGITNQYYLRNVDLSGDDTSFAWIDEDELYEYVCGNGVSPARFQSFLKYMCGDLLASQPVEDQPDYSDVYISETSSESDSDDSFDDENLDMLMTLASNKSFQSSDPPLTRTVRTKGKGRKKQLDLDQLDLDTDLMQNLQQQYSARREGKKQRKIKKDELSREDAIYNNDLLIKYDYSITIKAMKAEFESFWNDSARDTMSFPPLDGHGNKTLIKMAKFFNLRTLRCGKQHGYIKVSKCKTTYHYLPNQDLITRMLRQRPYFKRTDVGHMPPPKNSGITGFQEKSSGPSPHVREGDIVGAAAPEIPSDNIGRKMLEMLGWKTGEGLGAGNQGIPEPVQARVKKSKVGLGQTEPATPDTKPRVRDKRGKRRG
ncbi:protein Sqs1p [Diutina catenulata]